MKNRVKITKANNQIDFYFMSEKYGKKYLFSKPFSKGEFLYFQNGRSENELHSYHNWNKNPRLDKTIKRVIMMCRYAEKDMEASIDYIPVDLAQESREAKYRRLAAEYCR